MAIAATGVRCALRLSLNLLPFHQPTIQGGNGDRRVPVPFGTRAAGGRRSPDYTLLVSFGTPDP